MHDIVSFDDVFMEKHAIALPEPVRHWWHERRASKDIDRIDREISNRETQLVAHRDTLSQIREQADKARRLGKADDFAKLMQQHDIVRTDMARIEGRIKTLLGRAQDIVASFTSKFPESDAAEQLHQKVLGMRLQPIEVTTEGASLLRRAVEYARNHPVRVGLPVAVGTALLARGIGKHIERKRQQRAEAAAMKALLPSSDIDR